ncbi:MAG: ABC transporter permease [Ruminococcaceae bacterium]|nr:ABC transporter permease [Oscillospiraceae bacterium]
MQERQNWKTHITSSKSAVKINFKEVWEYRDLTWLFVKRDFTAKYKQTVLGPLWAVIQPLLTTVVFSIVFGSLAGLTTSDVEGEVLQMPSFLFYMIGTVIWSYFSSTVTANSNTFITNRAIMGKVYYPRIVTPIATAIADLISFFIQILLFCGIVLVCNLVGITHIRFSKYMLLFPVMVIQLVLLSTGVGIIISSLTTKYRDLAMLVGFGLQLWQYLSPIPYGLALIPEKYLGLYMLNPVTPIVTTMRMAFLGQGYFNTLYYIISLVFTVAVFFVGMVLFNRIEKTFMDTV